MIRDARLLLFIVVTIAYVPLVLGEMAADYGVKSLLHVMMDGAWLVPAIALGGLCLERAGRFADRPWRVISLVSLFSFAMGETLAGLVKGTAVWPLWEGLWLACAAMACLIYMTDRRSWQPI